VNSIAPNPQFTIITDENTEESHEVTQEKIINNVKKGEYYISANSKHFFELSIFPN